MEISLSILNRVAGIKIEPELLWSLYWGNDYTLQEIGNIFGCSIMPIRWRMIEYDIPRRSRSCIVTDFTFNDRQKEIFEGCMLGDGALEWSANNCYFRNDDIHEEYLCWLQKQFGIEHISSVKPVYRDGYAYDYSLRTRVIPSIREEHKRWYPYEMRHGTHQNMQHKMTPKDIELTPIKILFWYIGDGCYDNDGKTAMFTNYFDFDTWEMLSKKMCKVLDIDRGFFINKCGKDNKGKQKYLLRLNKSTTRKFFDIVDSLGFDIPDCYQYKFGR